MIREYLNKFAKKIVHRNLKKISNGQLLITESNNIYKFGTQSVLKAEIKVTNPSFYTEILLGGSIGASEAYIHKSWTSKDVTKVIQLMARNQSTMDSIEGPFRILTAPLLRILHALNRNTLYGSKKNIAQHYDLSNKFFSLFLDPSMMYSSAIYPNKTSTLEVAAEHKLDIICRKLDLKKSHHVIEIGSGWGGFAIHAAKHYGCHVTTTTISKEQYKYVCERIKQLKLEKHIKVIFKDYRELTGKYDKLVSIEMIEAVGHKFYDSYFKKISELLNKNGDALIQGITIRDQRYQKAIRSVDFIQKYIFPGSCIPSLNAIQNSITCSGDMVVYDLSDIGQHYAKTLADWRKKFTRNNKDIIKLGFDEEFIRMWLFYFCYCEGGFLEKSISNIHLHITKPDYRNKI
ncbi:MAG: cyclopropane-fatty-acyl-phospholipid synthase [Methylophilaceae bacterium]|jgi:cyclopropane-fatty-acyl-phospholipid synthase|nr:cyclopropane-fatty-acyl-phospholipid synthase [Methylophilaceae bacterium]